MDTENVTVIQHKNRWFNFTKLNRYELLLFFAGFLGIVVIFIIALVALSSNKDIKDEAFIFNIIIVISTLFCLVYLFRGIFDERSYELMVYAIAATCLAFYLLIDFIQNFDKATKLSYVSLAIAIFLTPATAVLATLLAYNYNIRGHLIFRTVEGHERLQDDCKNLFVFEALLQMDLQFELSMLTLMLAVNIGFGLDKILTFALGIPFSIAWHILGYISMRQELEIGVYLFLVLGVLEPAFVVYIVYNSITSIRNAISEPIINPVTPVVSITFALCFITLIIRILLSVIGVVVFKKFGNGLKDRLYHHCCEQSTKQSSELNNESELLLGAPSSIND